MALHTTLTPWRSAARMRWRPEIAALAVGPGAMPVAEPLAPPVAPPLAARPPAPRPATAAFASTMPAP